MFVIYLEIENWNVCYPEIKEIHLLIYNIDESGKETYLIEFIQ